MARLVRAALRRHRPLEVVRFVRYLPLFARLVIHLLGDRRVSWMARSVVVAAAAYVLAPVDLLPDIAPLLGQVDDLSLLILACRTFLRLCPPAVVEEHAARLDPSRRWRP